MVRTLGSLFPVSSLTLGGGGIGQVWGDTSRDEAEATVKLAYESGINLFDMAPSYGNGEAESVMGSVFSGGYPSDIRLTTKCMLGSVAATDVKAKLETSLAQSTARLGRDFIDVFILHGYVVDPTQFSDDRQEKLKAVMVSQMLFHETVVPVFEAWKASGRIGAWGMTSAGMLASDLDVIQADVKPDVVQCITNLLNSAGDMGIKKEDPTNHLQRLVSAKQANIGTMGIRAVAAGALTDNLDREIHPKSRMHDDMERSKAVKQFAADQGVSLAYLAHRYALSMPNVDTVVLGVKNRSELSECIGAAEAPKYTTDEMQTIDSLIS